MTKGRWWKLYFYFAVVMTVGSVTAPLWIDDESIMPWWEWLYVPLYILQAVSLFGFVYFHRIANALTWKTFFVVSVGYEISNAYNMATDWPPSASSVVIAAVLALVYFVQAPLWYGNFLYAFRYKAIWNANLTTRSSSLHFVPLGRR